jgi:hypothetical protein
MNLRRDNLILADETLCDLLGYFFGELRFKTWHVFLKFVLDMGVEVMH